jgi:cytoskeletal protein RodZ
MVFTSSKINGQEETVADKLRWARQEKKVTIIEASRRISIKPEYLQALEDGNYSLLPKGLYVKTFLKEYASYLGLSKDRIIKKFDEELGTKNTKTLDVFSKKKIEKHELLIFPKIIKNIIIICVILVFFSYLGYYLLKTFSLPAVEIFQPADNLVTSESSVNVMGRADTKTQISINNIQVLKDVSGNFSELINLNKGLNTITISAQNKYSREKIIQKQVLLK